MHNRAWLLGVLIGGFLVGSSGLILGAAKSEKASVSSTVRSGDINAVNSQIVVGGGSVVQTDSGLVVGNDSGPLHVAVALGRPVVGIYGPTDPAFVGPYGQLEHVVWAGVDCGPCRRHECADHRCMDGIGVDAVWKKVVGLLTI